MNILVIFCHPSKKSYTFQILEQIKAEIYKQKHSVKVSDLYEMNFQSDMTEQEYEREAFSNFDNEIPNDVKIEHEKLDWANSVIFLYPVWWSNCPAKLKGWFDRVYSVGYAYKNISGIKKMKKFNYGAVICTAGYSNSQLNEMGIAQSMKTIMLKDKLGDRFNNKKMFILGGTLDINGVKDNHAEVIANIIKEMSATSPNRVDGSASN
ncbi:NAD(P)H-dependent oxidoreductase [Flavobacterium polysaccharolyticum]|uniref:NAD(P)H-dependent oxidoreductase n=1 Tax=Flavobacterium polysaccharolyticum TaxID=3133148 RepID=A0ABU9NN78_9FLAO